MARKSGLSVVASQPEAQEPAPETAAPRTRAIRPGAPATAEASTPRPSIGKAKPATESASRYAGQYHVGASYDEADETVEAFRALAFKTRRKQKDLLHEAMRLLVDKYDPFKAR